MDELYGYTGKILHVDLSALTFRTEELPREVYATWLGGRGLGAYLLTRGGHHRIDPFADDALIAIVPGPLTATKTPGAGRLSMTAVSPLTGTLFDANSGGFFGHRLKGAGYDALVVTGRSEKLTGVTISPDGVKFHDAESFRGLGNRATRAKIAEETGEGLAALTIGQAGESGSLLANVSHDGRFFGRGGLGATFGWKGLKFIAAKGDYRPKIADPEKFDFVVNEARKLLAAHPITSKGLRQFGTAVMMNVMNAVKALPVANSREAEFHGAERISGEALRDTLLTGVHACPGCPVACGRKIKLDDETVEGPEFETLWAFGAAQKIDDLETIARLNILANDLGIDTVSAGSTIAAAAELFDRGLFPHNPLAKGPEGLAEVLRGMAENDGKWKPLANGAALLAQSLNAPDAAITVKGMELPAYDPRGCQGQGLAYATSTRGGCHMRSYMVAPEILASPKLIDRFATSGKAGLVIVGQNMNAAVDSLVMCRFMSFALKDEYYARLLRTVTGFDIDAQGFMTVGERICNLERLANLDRGFTRADDTLPTRLLTDPVGSGPAMGRPVALQPMLDEYYRFRGWDEEGRPTEKKLRALGLESDLRKID